MRYFNSRFLTKISSLVLSFALLFTSNAEAVTLSSSSSGSPGVDLSSFLVLKNGKKVSDVFKTPADMINLLVSNVFVIAGVYLFVLLIIGGFKVLQDESKGLQEAQTLWIQAGTGFCIMFGAYWVIQIIQVLTGVKILF